MNAALKLVVNPLRYWHTVRHLKWTQVRSRLQQRYRRLNMEHPDSVSARTVAEPIMPLRWRACALQADGSFEFLNERRQLPKSGGWNPPGVAKLWLYNLHYFDWINANRAAADEVLLNARTVEWIERWIAENPPPFGNGWEPYPTSLRIVNWFKWLWQRPAIGVARAASIEASLAIQAHVLSQGVETHLLGNHLFENAKALVFAGTYFEGALAERWFDLGAALLNRELDEQILEDGGYFELSPMYHATILEGVLDLVALQSIDPDPRWAKAGLPFDRLADNAQAMLRWLDRMSHPDGRIALFNDAAFAIAPDLAVIEGYASSLGLPLPPRERKDGVEWLQATGFVRVDRGTASMILDVGRVGPEYLPGHAHADTLSFEWSLGAERVIVDSGTSLYAEGAERLRQRGTAAHNTVVVDAVDSSEVWGQFRVARRAYPLDVRIDTSNDAWTVEAAHDGYRRLPGNVIHRRRWSITDRQLVVHDRLGGRFVTAYARFHFHPDVKVESGGGESIALALPSGRRITMRVLSGHAEIERATYHPEFGRSTPSKCVAVAIGRAEARVVFEF